MQKQFIKPSDIRLENYQEEVSRFCSRLPLHAHNAHMALGVADEYFELQEALEKSDEININEELGDLCWYVSQFCRQNRLEFAELIKDANIESNPGIAKMINMSKAQIAKYNKTFTIDDFRDAAVKAFAFILSKKPSTVPFVVILQKNYAKLAHRHGATFNADNATSRDVDAEREILS